MPPGFCSMNKAYISYYLGIGSVAAMLLSVLAGFLVESVGILNLFRGIVFPMSVAAIIFGVIARRDIAAEGESDWKKATAGLIMGIVVLASGIMIMITVAILFLPMLFA